MWAETHCEKLLAGSQDDTGIILCWCALRDSGVRAATISSSNEAVLELHAAEPEVRGGPQPDQRQGQQRHSKRIGAVPRRQQIAREADELRSNHQVAERRHKQE